MSDDGVLRPATASFDPVAPGHRFTLRYSSGAAGQRRGTVIVAPPFAEEMNRCRRMTALAATRLGALGFRVIVRDLLGCGDSSGHFEQASWSAWIDDLKRLLQEECEEETLWLWGVRSGALLLTDLIAARPDANVLLWQPAVSGRLALNQFLRLKTVAAALAGEERIEVKAIRAALFAGHPQDVAGYTLSPAVAGGLDAAELRLPTAFTGRVVWIEVSGSGALALRPVSEEVLAEWRARGVRVAASAVPGDEFWHTLESAECEALLDETLQLVTQD